MNKKIQLIQSVQKISLLLLIFSLWSCKEKHPTSQQEHIPIGEIWLDESKIKKSNIHWSSVEDRLFNSKITINGRITFDDLRISHVYSPVSGRVVQITASPGDRVEEGQGLCTIDSPDLGIAAADVDKAYTDLILSQKELKRAQELFQFQAIARRDLENSENLTNKAQAEYERSLKKSKLLSRQKNDQETENYVLRSLISGEVIARMVNPGMEIQGQYNGGNPVELFTIGELDTVWLTADIFEHDLAKVRKGQPLETIVMAYPDKKFSGRIDWVSNTLNPSTRTATIRGTLQNPERLLKPEMFATVQVITESKKMLAIPRRALLRHAGYTIVFVLISPKSTEKSNNKIRFIKKEIEVNENFEGDWLPVYYGLKEGDQIVTDGAVMLLPLLL